MSSLSELTGTEAWTITSCGAAAAAFVYDYLANPRTVQEPIEEAVTHPDPAELGVDGNARDLAHAK